MTSNENRGGAGNFANDPKRAAEAGRKGGEQSHGGQQHQQESGADKRQQESPTEKRQQGTQTRSDDHKSGQR